MLMGKKQREKGAIWVWLSSLCLAAILTTVAVMLLVVVRNGVGVFWPSRVALLTLDDGTRALGEVMQWQTAADGKGRRVQLKIGNRDLYGLDFRWFDEVAIRQLTYPAAAVCVERREHGNFYGFLKGDTAAAETAAAAGSALRQRFLATWQDVQAQAAAAAVLQSAASRVNGNREGLRLQLLRRRYHGLPDDSPATRALLATDAELKARFTALVDEQGRLLGALRQHTTTFVDAGGLEKETPVVDVVRLHQPNTMSFAAKLGFCLGKIWELLTGEPREANTEGGLFPAIVGTVMMVFVMSIFSFPLGVITAVYLREYAKDGLLVRLVRIAVSNLAGIPSIVYGIFGLGFFVYGVGGALDRLLYPERLPTPTFGTGGILWASLTLALLTVPVVIVATEEAFAAIPRGVREGSLALGATQLQTLVRVLLPMASPGILTGFILAMARAAGEVAPLMITGVVKLAPTLPVDGGFPYLHLNRKFMHLGFHIYDVGFQSPNVEAAKPMVFVTTLLLVLTVLLLSSTAIILRNKMKKRYTLTSF
jgi:phosphate transport system permease protein